MSIKVIPVQTKIITPRDDLIRIISTYVAPLLQPGDTLAISESVVAITQGRIIRPEQVRLSCWAKLCSRFIHPDGSLSSPYAMQVIMDDVGTVRVVGAFCISALTRVLMRRKGDFYRLAGQQASLVDDITGTMPPFDKHIILGPREPEKTVSDIRRHFQVEAIIIDANDLGRAHILASTPGVQQQQMIKIFKDNPAGNADQRTPFVIVRKVPPPNLLAAYQKINQ